MSDELYTVKLLTWKEQVKRGRTEQVPLLIHAAKPYERLDLAAGTARFISQKGHLAYVMNGKSIEIIFRDGREVEHNLICKHRDLQLTLRFKR